MPKRTALEYAAYIRALKEERDSLADENEELNSFLDEIEALAGDAEDDEGEDDE